MTALADLATVRSAVNRKPIPVPRAVFGHCRCGILTVWQEGEKPVYTCSQCLRKQRLQAEHEHPTLISLVNQAEALLRQAGDQDRDSVAGPHGSHLAATKPATVLSFHDAEHVVGWEGESKALIEHLRRHMREDP